MKRFICLLLALCMLPLTALGWGAEGYYDGAEAMPPALANLVQNTGVMIDNCYNGNTVYVTFACKKDHVQLAIYRLVDDQWQWIAGTPVVAGISFGSTSKNEVMVFTGDAIYGYAETLHNGWVLCWIQGNMNVNFNFQGLWYDSTENGTYVEHRIYGDHPFLRLDDLDTAALPLTLEDCFAMIDSQNWGVVSNPVPTDRLHLRTKPSKDANSLGKYYNGTPVKIISQSGDWAKVSVGSTNGYMLKQYIATYPAMNQIEPRFSDYTLTEEANESNKAIVYTQPSTSSQWVTTLGKASTLSLYYHIVGVVGDDWFHIMWNTGDEGYVQSKYFCPGNG